MIQYNQRGDLGNQLSRLEHQSEEHPTFFSFFATIEREKKKGWRVNTLFSVVENKRGVKS
ncbi:hypothetical protein CGSMWGv00703C2mash_01029 [Gardnerella pickettii 00703C2mash]|nr:hypothetical protein CGSMWGv00703C2mash_01029 [Gardnerella pickettii 00703C2mash]